MPIVQKTYCKEIACYSVSALIVRLSLVPCIIMHSLSLYYRFLVNKSCVLLLLLFATGTWPIARTSRAEAFSGPTAQPVTTHTGVGVCVCVCVCRNNAEVLASRVRACGEQSVSSLFYFAGQTAPPVHNTGHPVSTDPYRSGASRPVKSRSYRLGGCSSTYFVVQFYR